MSATKVRLFGRCAPADVGTARRLGTADRGHERPIEALCAQADFTGMWPLLAEAVLCSFWSRCSLDFEPIVLLLKSLPAGAYQSNQVTWPS
jgi:hypothetical protein